MEEIKSSVRPYDVNQQYKQSLKGPPHYYRVSVMSGYRTASSTITGCLAPFHHLDHAGHAHTVPSTGPEPGSHQRGAWVPSSRGGDAAVRGRGRGGVRNARARALGITQADGRRPSV